MVLETEGTFTVVPKIEGLEKSTLRSVRGYSRRCEGQAGNTETSREVGD